MPKLILDRCNHYAPPHVQSPLIWTVDKSQQQLNPTNFFFGEVLRIEPTIDSFEAKRFPLRYLVLLTLICIFSLDFHTFMNIERWKF